MMKTSEILPALDRPIDEVRLFNYPVHLVNALQARVVVEQAILEHRSMHVVTLNPEMIMQGDDTPELGRILKSAGLVLPDGAGVVWALRRKGYQAKRLPGIEFSESLLKWAASIGYKVALIGARQEALEQAVCTLRERYPALQIVYQHHGFFQPGAEEEQIARACAETAPQIVLVALGVPRQELWIDAYKGLFDGTAFVGIGGSLDVWSGQTQRAPGLMRRFNLEWAYRISSEPWRIKRIYKSLPMFVVKVLLSRP